MQITQQMVDASGGGIVAVAPERADLTAAFNAIRNKRPDLDLLFSYYEGPQPLKYSTEKLAELFRNINAHFEQNWMSVVVDATLDRIQLNGFTTKDGNADADAKFKLLFDKLHIDIEADKAHLASLTTSQGYVIVWQDEGETVVYYNDPRMCHVFYEDANPRKKRYAAKWFSNGGGQEITLYYVDRIEHWVSQKSSVALDKANSFMLASVEANTFGVIPVFELKSQGEIFKVLTSQDAVNKLFADMMTAAEFGSVMQRYVISQSDPGALKNSPNEIWWLPAADGQGEGTTVGQFQSTPLDNFSVQMEKIANHIFINTRTPKHYLMETGANISGEALLAMEAPLNKKCKKRQNYFASQWQDIAAFIAQLEGIDTTPDNINCVWERIESIQPKTDAETRQVNVNSGVPLEVALKWEGRTPDDIKEITDAKQAADNKAAKRLQDRLNAVRVPVDMIGGVNGGQA